MPAPPAAAWIRPCRQEILASRRPLTLEESSARLEAAGSARTRGELARVLEDLPASDTPAPAPADRVTHRGWAVAVLGDAARRGRWNPGPVTGAVSVFGDVELDLRGAEVRGPTLDVHAYTFLGDVRIRSTPRPPGFFARLFKRSTEADG